MSILNLTCEYCTKPFQRGKSEVSRNRKLGRKMFCSRFCAGKGNDNLAGKGNTSTAHLDSANRLDAFSAFRYYERKARARMSSRNCENSDITLEQIKTQWDKQKGLCVYTGIPLTLWSPKRNPTTHPWEVASLDRIDSLQPYTEGNIQFVSTNINFLKSTLSDAQTRVLLDIIRLGPINR